MGYSVEIAAIVEHLPEEKGCRLLSERVLLWGVLVEKYQGIFMLPTYRAIIENNQLRWIDETPERALQHQPLYVLVTIPDEPPQPDKELCELRRAKVTEILRQMAERHSLNEITDPVSWQRERREDRPLPGRE
jgi:hypothetical protein